MIKFSILVPVYNVERYISECIESVLNQNYSDFELLLVDDGSTDKSGDICREYAIRETRITSYHMKNYGIVHARRFGIEKASGDYYIFLDSDDTLKKNALEVIADTITKYKCDTVIYGFERVYDGRIISQTYDSEEVCLKDKKDIYNRVFFELDKNAMWRKAVKADVFKDLDYSLYYHIKMGEDLLQSLEIYHNSKTVAFISDILYEYRMNPQSITHTNTRTNIDFTVRRKTLEFLQNDKVFSEEDFNRYRDFCIGLLIDTIRRIGFWDVPMSKKKELFWQIRKDDYYKEFLSKGITNRKEVGAKSTIYDLFRNKKDTVLLTALRLWGKIKQ